MRFNRSSSSLLALSCVVVLSVALPLIPQQQNVAIEPLVRRATYSVVAVNGPTTTAAAAPATVVETTTQTPAATTLIKTDTLSASTDTVISTITATGTESTQTVLVSVTAKPATVTTIRYSVIDVSPPVTVDVLVTVSATGSNPTAASQTPAVTTIPASQSALHSAPTSNPDATVPQSTGHLSSYTTTTIVPSTLTSAAALSLSSATSLPYDNGQWHTTYRAWSNLTSTAAMYNRS
jgi:hypothetical protein